jgi:hypothetical protein
MQIAVSSGSARVHVVAADAPDGGDRENNATNHFQNTSSSTL